MAKVEIESNHMRRSHRVDLPLAVIVEQKVYLTKNWSLTGLGIKDLEPQYEHGDQVKAAIILQFKEAKLEIPVLLEFKNRREDVSGFEFVNLSESNRRVLREFLELSIEGRLENADGILGIYNEPVINTPIKESVVLSDAEESSLTKAYKKRTRFYLGFGALLLLTIIITIFYNLQYVYRSIGIVSGNFVKVSPSISGKLSAIYVKVGDSVTPDSILFELDEQMLVDKIDIIDEKLQNMELFGETPQPRQSDPALLQMLKQEMQEKQHAYKASRSLFERRIISISDFQRMKEQYQRANQRYMQERDRTALRPDSLNQPMIALKTELQLRRAELINQLGYMRVSAGVHGRVYAIKSNIGNFVGSSDEVMVLQTDDEPYIVCKVMRDEAVYIRHGMPVKIYVPSMDKTFSAYVETLGNLSINTESMVSNEVSLKEVTVKIRFTQPIGDLPLNERVKVWFYKPILG